MVRSGWPCYDSRRRPGHPHDDHIVAVIGEAPLAWHRAGQPAARSLPPDGSAWPLQREGAAMLSSHGWMVIVLRGRRPLAGGKLNGGAVVAVRQVRVTKPGDSLKLPQVRSSQNHHSEGRRRQCAAGFVPPEHPSRRFARWWHRGGPSSGAWCAPGRGRLTNHRLGIPARVCRSSGARGHGLRLR